MDTADLVNSRNERFKINDRIVINSDFIVIGNNLNKLFRTAPGIGVVCLVKSVLTLDIHI